MKGTFQKIQIMHLMAGMAFLLLSLLAFLFLYIDMRKKRLSAQEAELAWRVEAERRSELQSVNRSLKALEPERVLFDTHFIKGADVVPFLNMLESLAGKAGAKIEVSLVDVLKDGAGVVTEMRVGGRYESVYKFLLLLENSAYELEFLTIDVQKADAVDDEGRVSSEWLGIFRVKLLSYVK